MLGHKKLRRYLSLLLAAGTVATAHGEADPAGDTFLIPDPNDPSGSTAPDIIDVDVREVADQILVVLQFAGEVRPADDFSAIDLQVRGTIDFGVAADVPTTLSHKSTLTIVPSDLELIAYLDLTTVSQSSIRLLDGSDALLTNLPIAFGFDTLSVEVPVDLLPSPVEGYAALVNNFVQDTWDMFPNGRGHATIVPEPGTLSLFVLSLATICRRRHHSA